MTPTTRTVCISARKVKKKDGELYVREVIQNVTEVMNVMLSNVKTQIKWRSLTWEQNHTNIFENIFERSPLDCLFTNQTRGDKKWSVWFPNFAKREKTILRTHNWLPGLNKIENKKADFHKIINTKKVL